MKPILRTGLIALCTASAFGQPSTAEQLISDTLIVDGQACIGTGCVSGEAFFQEELIIKGPNPNIWIRDTSRISTSDMDWGILVNAGVGNEAFWLVQNESSGVPFIVEGTAGPNSLVVGQYGVGLGEPVPSMELHIKDGDTPTIRLEQDTNISNPAQLWDIGGNDANFFIRNGDSDALPFRIRPGAPSNALYVAGNGEVGMGIPDPQGALHIRRNQPDNVPHLILQTRRADGRVELWMTDQGAPGATDTVKLQLIDDVFNVSYDGTGAAEFQIFKSGDVRVRRGDLIVETGSIRVGGSTLNVPDYVFAPDYDLMPLSDVAAFIDTHSHLPHIPSAAEVAENGLDVTAMVLALLKSHEELTLHTIALQAEIDALKSRLD